MGAAKRCPVKKLEVREGIPHFLSCELNRHADPNHSADGTNWKAPSPPVKGGKDRGAEVSGTLR